MTRPILVVGSVNMDAVCAVDRIPRPGETVLGQDVQFFHGGKGANQAAGIARLGHPVRMVGRVGDDSTGAQLRAGLRAAGVDVRRLATTRG
ncbi:MAG TPA: PfkB family carbohydrate kinase, partial [Gemmatimonadaceae bacterium]|nr:PfkB family carbohydrate kinase [Gemmatimonadaceae bacterium]